MEDLFKGRHFDREVIILCVRWYLRFKLSSRDLVEMMAERSLSMAHTTIMRWVHHYSAEFEGRWNRFAQPAGAPGRVDEPYVKVHGEWVYLYRAVDGAGNTVDFRLIPKRDVAAAKAFFRKAIKGQGTGPRTITCTPPRVIRNSPALVTAVDHMSEAYSRGFCLGVVIEQIDGQPVATPAEALRFLNEAKQRLPLVAFLVQWSDGRRWVTLHTGYQPTSTSGQAIDAATATGRSPVDAVSQRRPVSAEGP